jgi:glycosyltransferase involved in cell wall biosynthesis
MPNVLLEAGALGIPSIGSDIDGMKDVIEHGKNGFLFSPGNKNECRDVLVQFVSLSSDEKEMMGKQMKERIHAEFNHNKEVENYANILNNGSEDRILV